MATCFAVSNSGFLFKALQQKLMMTWWLTIAMRTFSSSTWKAPARTSTILLLRKWSTIRDSEVLLLEKCIMVNLVIWSECYSVEFVLSGYAWRSTAFTYSVSLLLWLFYRVMSFIFFTSSVDFYYMFRASRRVLSLCTLVLIYFYFS